MGISGAAQIAVRDLTSGGVAVVTIEQAAAGASRYRVIGYDPGTGEPADMTLAEAVEARFENAATHRPGSPAAAAVSQRAIEFANAAGYEIRRPGRRG